MPGYDESLEIPDWLEPPRMDADETLPNMIHPSYPFGRPHTGKSSGAGSGAGKKGHGGGAGNLTSGQERGVERWDELGDGLIEDKKGKEVPPGMAVSLQFTLGSMYLLHIQPHPPINSTRQSRPVP